MHFGQILRHNGIFDRMIFSALRNRTINSSKLFRKAMFKKSSKGVFRNKLTKLRFRIGLLFCIYKIKALSLIDISKINNLLWWLCEFTNIKGISIYKQDQLLPLSSQTIWWFTSFWTYSFQISGENMGMRKKAGRFLSAETLGRRGTNAGGLATMEIAELRKRTNLLNFI